MDCDSLYSLQPQTYMDKLQQQEEYMLLIYRVQLILQITVFGIDMNCAQSARPCNAEAVIQRHLEKMKTARTRPS